MKQNKITWIASWPKAGNSWAYMFLLAYIYGPEWQEKSKILIYTDNILELYQALTKKPLYQLAPSEILDLRLETLRAILYRTQPSSPYIKTHCANVRFHNRLLIHDALTEKALIIVRDPRDCCVSFAKWTFNTIDDMIMVMNSDHHPLVKDHIIEAMGSWTTFHKSWLHNNDPWPHLMLRYEDLHTNPVHSFRKLLKFFDLKFNKIRFNAALKAASFESLSKWEGAPISSGAGTKLFRQGKVGTWKNDLTPAQAKQIELDHKEMMTELGYL